MRAYHGTVVENLKVLKPFHSPFSNYERPCVYLTTSSALAALYIWSKPYKWLTFESGEDGTPIYIESFENSLAYFYKKVSGSIYTCKGNFISKDPVGIASAVISHELVPVSSAEIIPDAYEYILHLESKNLMKIEHFRSLTEERKSANYNMVKNAILRLKLHEGIHPLSVFVQEIFPEIWSDTLAFLKQK